QEPPSFFPPSFCISFSLSLSLSLHFSLSISLCLSLSISLSLSLHFSLFGLQTDGGSCLPHSQKLPKIIHHKCVCAHVCVCVCVCVFNSSFSSRQQHCDVSFEDVINRQIHSRLNASEICMSVIRSSIGII